MPRRYEGHLLGTGKKFAIVASRFNDFICERLLDGAKDALLRHGVKEEDIEIARVPGSFEMPLVAKKMAQSGRYHAIVCLGAIIRGETPHFEYIAAEAAKGASSVALETGIPVAFGVLTTDTLEQAVDRAGAKGGNKGYDAAVNAIEMANLLESLPSRK